MEEYENKYGTGYKAHTHTHPARRGAAGQTDRRADSCGGPAGLFREVTRSRRRHTPSSPPPPDDRTSLIRRSCRTNLLSITARRTPRSTERPFLVRFSALILAFSRANQKRSARRSHARLFLSRPIDRSTARSRLKFKFSHVNRRQVVNRNGGLITAGVD